MNDLSSREKNLIWTGLAIIAVILFLWFTSYQAQRKTIDSQSKDIEVLTMMAKAMAKPPARQSQYSSQRPQQIQPKKIKCSEDSLAWEDTIECEVSPF